MGGDPCSALTGGGVHSICPGSRGWREAGAAGAAEPDAAGAAEPDAAGDFGALVRRLLGREPSGPELAEFVRVRDALGLRDNDALWLVLLALQHQRRQLERAIDDRRREFEAAVDRRLEKAQTTADALVESAKTRFLEQFPAALKQAARRVAIKALGFNGPVAGAALALVGLGAVGAVGLAHALGERSGYERGMRAAQAEIAPAPKPPAPAVRGR
ncbi:MAG: hypothetical protein V9H25_07520 [Candidatus Competibacter sp.]